MNTTQFNNETDFSNWYSSQLATFPVIIEGGGTFEPPKEYPCVMVYLFVENPYLDCEGEEEDYRELKEEGYCSDEIELFKYQYIYKEDFD